MTGSHFADGIEFEETFPEAAVEAHAAYEPAPQTAPVRDAAAATDTTEARYQEKLERRLRDVEAMVKETIERMRLMEQRSTHAEGLAERIQAMLVEWQGRFEQRLEQRHVELERALTERFAQRQVAERAPLPDRNGEVRPSLRDRVAATTSARDVGRVLRDVLAEVTRSAAFALSVHQADREEVAYRYRVASDGELGTLLRREAVDDGPQSAAANTAGWVRAQRTIRVGSRNVTIHTAQLAVRSADVAVGVLTLQTEEDAIADSILARIDDLVAISAQHLSALRDNGSYRSV